MPSETELPTTVSERWSGGAVGRVGIGCLGICEANMLMASRRAHYATSNTDRCAEPITPGATNSTIFKVAHNIWVAPRQAIVTMRCVRIHERSRSYIQVADVSRCVDINGPEPAVAPSRAVRQRLVLVRHIPCGGEALFEDFEKSRVFEGRRDTFLVVELLVHWADRVGQHIASYTSREDMKDHETHARVRSGGSQA